MKLINRDSSYQVVFVNVTARAEVEDRADITETLLSYAKDVFLRAKEETTVGENVMLTSTSDKDTHVF